MKDHIVNAGFGLFKIFKVLIHGKIGFEDSIDSFGNGIFSGVTILSHTNLNTRS